MRSAIAAALSGLFFAAVAGGAENAPAPVVHTVVRGDTLYGISRKYGVPAQKIAGANGIKLSSILRIGQKLTIPGAQASPQPKGPIPVPPATDPLPDLTPFGRPTPSNAAPPGATTAATALTNAGPPPKPEASSPPAPPGAHTVAAGDTPQSIAATYGLPADDLLAWNRLNRGDSLRIGQIIRLTAPPEFDPQDESPRATKPPAKTSPEPAAPPEPKPSPKAPEPKPKPEPKEKSRPPEPPAPPKRASSGSKDIPTARTGDSRKPSERAPEPDEESGDDSPGPAVPASGVFLKPVRSSLEAPSVKKGRWKYVVIHNSGSRRGSAAIFDHYHRSKGMENGLAYHFVIGNGTDTRDGEIEIGKRWHRQIQGGHVYSDYLNEISLGICLVGDFNRSRPTSRQFASCFELLDWISRRCRPAPRVRLHREINPRPTDCPGRLFPAALFYRRLDS